MTLRHCARLTLGLPFALACLAAGAVAGDMMFLTGTPDYEWLYGCFGTATGNLMGYWDRHGYPNFYTGPTAGGVAPLRSYGSNAGIRSMWASQAGFDGRPGDRRGHLDDYWVGYESPAPDPYVAAHRTEHAPDCIGDFIGLSQNKWKNLNGECDGNLDAYVFVFWDTTGARRFNYDPAVAGGPSAADVPTGLRAWTRYRGSEADVFTQLSDFNPEAPPGTGFTYEDLKAEIRAGYPILAFCQPAGEKYRAIGSMSRANPEIHGMMIYGYYETDWGAFEVLVRTSWASGDYVFREWTPATWVPWLSDFPVRGLIAYHPRPRITSVTRADGRITVNWEGPDSELNANGALIPLHSYVIERASALGAGQFAPVAPAVTARTLTFTDPGGPSLFFRVKLVTASAGG